MFRLLEEPALTAQLTEAARASCDRYTWASVRHEWIDVYRSLVPARALTAPRPA
jgi:hypothetical protein